MTKRHGFTLIEMLAALTVGAVVSGIAIGLLVMLLRLDRTGRDHAHWANSLGRLAEQFRDDVHASTTSPASNPQEPDQWQFTLGPNRTANYRVAPERIERDERVDDKTVRRESYAIPPGSTARVAVSAERKPPLVSLIVAPASSSFNAPLGMNREIRVEAVLGRDRRFAKSESGSKHEPD